MQKKIKNITIPCSPEMKQQLEAVAKEGKFIGQRGASITVMLREIAAGNAVVVKVEGEE